jgi:hypothetical protein
LATMEAAGQRAAMSFSDDEEVFKFGLGLLVDGLRPLRSSTPPPL